MKSALPRENADNLKIRITDLDLPRDSENGCADSLKFENQNNTREICGIGSMFEIGQDSRVDAFDISMDPKMSEEDKSLFQWTRMSSDDEDGLTILFNATKGGSYGWRLEWTTEDFSDDEDNFPLL
ncbi:Oidioi.mRNA.OKI2018_I69.chr1.g798.t2.cds [Oikopleura dioica]|uniref:Oidioi.mRNA.OKI2018_I69.chr1.g798.t2.cds n=1 Tax=Oikopleura dioica TaxID=34765 RepID=A0ABN7SPM2_OIKDI|nr:Oidioi.mRNA.OKI2018_I69.chr1.g798.t2.cds [Oikopleura dioica]